MTTPPFLVFPEDEHAVQLDKIVGFVALGENDIDPATAKYRRPIPEGAQTRVDTVSGYFWVKTPFADVLDLLALLEGTDG